MTRALVTVRNGASVTAIHDAVLAASWTRSLAATLLTAPGGEHDPALTVDAEPHRSMTTPLVEDSSFAGYVKQTTATPAEPVAECISTSCITAQKFLDAPDLSALMRAGGDSVYAMGSVREEYDGGPQHEEKVERPYRRRLTPLDPGKSLNCPPGHVAHGRGTASRV